MRAEMVAASPMQARYGIRLDRDSAREKLARRSSDVAGKDDGVGHGRWWNGDAALNEPRSRVRRPAKGLGQAIAGAVVRELGGVTGRRIVRGILGGLFRGR